MALKIRYNSPVVLTFSLICIGVYVVDLAFSIGSAPNTIGPMTRQFFTLSGFNWGNPLDYLLYRYPTFFCICQVICATCTKLRAAAIGYRVVGHSYVMFSLSFFFLPAWVKLFAQRCLSAAWAGQ